MPYLDPPTVFYENLNAKKYNDIKAEILKLYIDNLENSFYDYDAIYPNQR